MKKKNNKGFTLIELLAVIIILGVLMLVAIPSVTTYINNSKKESYIFTVKELINSASHKVNSGELDVYDQSITYYIPTECIAVENAKTSPYGDLKDSYVVVTYNNDGFDYYYTGTDTANMGIYLTYRELIDIKSINSSVTKIEPSVSIGNSSSIIVFDCNGNKTEVEPLMSVDPETLFTADLIEEYNEVVVENNPLANYKETDYILERQGSTSTWYLHVSPVEDKIEKISFINGKVPSNAISSWDAGVTKGGKLMGWLTDVDNNGLYELTFGSKKTIYLNPYCGQLFKAMFNVKIIDFQNIDTSKVTDMHEMFTGNGSDYHMSLEHIYGLNKFDTSNVRNMNDAFGYCGNLKELDLSSFDTRNLQTAENMFNELSKFGNITKLDLSNFDLSNLISTKGMFSWNNRLTEIKFGKNKSSKLTNASGMFQFDGNLTSLDISNLKIDDSVNITKMLDALRQGAVIYVDSETTRDYILNNRAKIGLRDFITASNFVIK